MNRETFHHSKVFSGCSIEEHSWLWPTSENHKQRAPPLQQRPGKRRRIEGEVEKRLQGAHVDKGDFWVIFVFKNMVTSNNEWQTSRAAQKAQFKGFSNKEI